MATAREILTFRALLTPRVYRDIEVANGCTLYKLAEAVIDAYSFAFDHCFGFYSNLGQACWKSERGYELFADIGEESEFEGVERTKALEAFPEIGAKMQMLFDYGDEWRFVIELRARRLREAGLKLPRLVKSAGEAPPQYEYPDDDEDDA